MLIGRPGGRLMRFLLWLMVWLTVLVLPVVLLLAGQVRFLPYHDAWTTMWHRVLVGTDVLLILIFWRPIRYPTDQLLACPRRWIWHQMKALPLALAALALSLLVFTFPGDAETPKLAIHDAPVGLGWRLWRGEGCHAAAGSAGRSAELSGAIRHG
jgi:hypothetical protein